MKNSLRFACLVFVAISLTTIAIYSKRTPWSGQIAMASRSGAAQRFTSQSNKQSGAATNQAEATPRGIMMFDRIENAPAWTIRYGEEFWHKRGIESVDENGNLDYGSIIERVSHAIRDRDASGAPQAHMLKYKVSFSDLGFTISPNRFVRQETIASEASRRSANRTYPIYEENPRIQAAFRTEAIRCGGETLYEPRLGIECSFLGNTGQRLLNEGQGLVEHYQTSQDGVEVTWVLGKSPPRGELEITASVTGLEYLGPNGDEHLFADGEGKPAIRIGETIVVDAKGASATVPTRFVNGNLVINVPETMIADLTFPIAIDPTIGPAFGGGDPMAANTQHDSAVAWNSASGVYLVVWSDYRSGGAGLAGHWEIYGARVLPNGRVVDATGWFRVSSEQASNVHQENPRIASNGTDWFVAWRRFAAATESTPAILGDIIGVRISSGLTKGAEIPICTQASEQQSVDVGLLGTEYLAVWSDFRDAPSIATVYGARITASDTVDPSNGRWICQWLDGGNVVHQGIPQVAGNGTTCLVVWNGECDSPFGGVYGAVVTSSWGVTCTPRMSELTRGGNAAVAGRNGEWLAAWSQLTSCVGGDLEIWARRVDGAGNPLGSAIQITTASESDDEDFPQVANNGSGYLVAWLSRDFFYDVRGALVSSNGVVQAPGAFNISATSANDIDVAMGSDGTNYLAVWAAGMTHEADPPSDFNVYGGRVLSSAPPGNVLDRFPISTIGGNQMLETSLPHDNGAQENTLVVWVYNNNGSNWDIYAARVDPTTRVLDVNGLAIATGPAVQANPQVAFGYFGWLVTWEESGKVFAKRVDGTEGLISSHVQVSSPSAYGPRRSAVAGINGLNWLVVWEDDRNYLSTQWDIYGAVVSYNGSALQVGADFNITPRTADQAYPAVAGDGFKYLLAWEEVDAGDGKPDIRGQLVTSAGTLSGPWFWICLEEETSQSRVAVAGKRNGGGFGVVWADDRNGNYDIYGISVTSSGAVGTPLSGVRITTSNLPDYLPSITDADTASNNGFLIAWVTWESSQNIYGARMIVEANNNVLLDGTGVFPINTFAGTQDYPTLSTIFTFPVWQQFVGYDSSYGGSVIRPRMNLISFP